MFHLFENRFALLTPVSNTDGVVGEPLENERDEAGILTNQDETGIDPNLNSEDTMMGAGPTNEFVANENADFDRGEVDLVEQMKRTERDYDYPNRAATIHGPKSNPTTDQ